MAGRGPAPKPKGERRTRVVPQRGDWVELEPLPKAILPTLPARGRGQGTWSKRTRAMYEGWRLDPVTQTYGPTEVAAVIELAYLQEEVSRGKVALATEVRQRADGLGLTLKGKRDLRFVVVRPEKPEDDGKPKRRGRAAAGGDRRARLTVVK